MEPVIIIAWITFSVLVGTLGSDRKIGFWGSFLLSIILSPVIALFITLFSKSLTQQRIDDEMLQNQKEQTRLLAEKSDINLVSIADEIEKLISLKDKGLLTEEEFQKAKQRLINKD